MTQKKTVVRKFNKLKKAPDLDVLRKLAYATEASLSITIHVSRPICRL